MRHGIRAGFVLPAVPLLGLLFWCEPVHASTIVYNSLSDAPYNLAAYGHIPDGFGSTAEVTVSYQTTSASHAVLDSFLYYWPGGYGDLPAVALAAAGGAYADITLTPAPGHQLTLEMFALAGLGGDVAGQTVRVLQGVGGTLLWDVSPVAIAGGLAHSSFAPSLVSTGPVTIDFGPSGSVGINYIWFEAAEATSDAPEPAAMPLCLGALLLLPILRRRAG